MQLDYYTIQRPYNFIWKIISINVYAQKLWAVKPKIQGAGQTSRNEKKWQERNFSSKSEQVKSGS